MYVSGDPSLLDLDWITEVVTAQPWGAWRSPDIIRQAVAGSRSFGMYVHQVQPGSGPTRRDRQIGFCRIVTDGAVFSWLADVVIDEEYRRQGYGSFMVSRVLPFCKGAVYLSTRDRHLFYERIGFTRLGNSDVMRKISNA